MARDNAHLKLFVGLLMLLFVHSLVNSFDFILFCAFICVSPNWLRWLILWSSSKYSKRVFVYSVTSKLKTEKNNNTTRCGHTVQSRWKTCFYESVWPSPHSIHREWERERVYGDVSKIHRHIILSDGGNAMWVEKPQNFLWSFSYARCV